MRRTLFIIIIHHWLNGHEFEQTLRDGEGHGSLVCCSPWVAKSRTRLSDRTTTKQNFIQGFLAFFVSLRKSKFSHYSRLNAKLTSDVTVCTSLFNFFCHFHLFFEKKIQIFVCLSLLIIRNYKILNNIEWML